MLDTMNTARVIGGGGGVRTAARVLGVGIVSTFVNAVIFYVALLFLYEKRDPWLLWLIPVAIVSAPAYGWMEYRAARQRNQSRPTRAAKVAAIFILAANVLLLACVWLFAYGIEHWGIR